MIGAEGDQLLTAHRPLSRCVLAIPPSMSAAFLTLFASLPSTRASLAGAGRFARFVYEQF